MGLGVAGCWGMLGLGVIVVVLCCRVLDVNVFFGFGLGVIWWGRVRDRLFCLGLGVFIYMVGGCFFDVDWIGVWGVGGLCWLEGVGLGCLGVGFDCGVCDVGVLGVLGEFCWGWVFWLGVFFVFCNLGFICGLLGIFWWDIGGGCVVVLWGVFVCGRWWYVGWGGRVCVVWVFWSGVVVDCGGCVVVGVVCLGGFGGYLLRFECCGGVVCVSERGMLCGFSWG